VRGKQHLTRGVGAHRRGLGDRPHLGRGQVGEDVDLGQRLPSDLIIAATEGRPEFVPAVGPYLAMRALPDSLDAIEPQIRDLYAQGRRPPTPLGPSRDELADLVAEAMYGARYNAGERAVAYA
jgi:hypothetical protein